MDKKNLLHSTWITTSASSKGENSDFEAVDPLISAFNQF